MNCLKYLFIIVCISLCCYGSVLAQESAEQITPEGGVTLSWDPNTETDLAGYKIHIGTVSGTYDTVIDVKNVTRYTVTELVVDKTYYFALTAHDTWKNNSMYSKEVSGTAKDIIVPEQPKNFKEVTTSVNNLGKD